MLKKLFLQIVFILEITQMSINCLRDKQILVYP